MVDLIQYDAAVTEWAEYYLRSALGAVITTMNAQIAAHALMTTITIPTPETMNIEARDESDLDERGQRPQDTDGVWIAVTNSVDETSLAFQPGYTRHTLRLLTFVTATDAEDATPSTTNPTGYKRCMYLARAVEGTLGENLDCPNFGVLSFSSDGGQRLKRVTRGMPSTHEILTTLTVLQKTHRPLGVA